MSATIDSAPVTNALLRNVVDLRAFAADPALGVPVGETGDAWFAARRMVPDARGAVTIGVLTLTGAGRVATLPADEFVFVLTGRLTVGTITLAPDRGAVLPKDFGFAWQAEPGTTAIVLRCDAGAPGTDAPVPIDLDAALAPSNPPAAGLLLSAAPACRSHTDYLSASGEFMAGMWDSTPYHRRHIDYGHCELMHLLAGSVTFEDENGNRRTFRKDDLFVVLRGARCSWLSEEDCAKLWVIYRPAA